MKKIIKYLILSLTSAMLIYISLINNSKNSEAANDGFNIKNGILISYYGIDKNVIIPKTVKEIGYEAFYNKSVETVVIPDTVTKIGKHSFTLCTKLKSIQLSKKITIIPYGAFMSCTNLESIVIPKNIAVIDNCSFFNCKKLKQIKILNDKVYIGSEVFVDTAWLVSKNDEFVVINGNLIQYNGDDPIIKIPNDIRVICGKAFSELEGLEKVTIPSSVEIIGEYAFDQCGDLRKVYMSNSVTTINEHAFNQCYSLENITLSNNLKYIGDAAFYSSGLTSITIPQSVEHIDYHAFGACDNLIDVVIPEDLTNIASNAFLWTPWVEHIIEESKAEFVIVNSKLYKYKGNSDIVTIPNGVTAIMAEAFKNSNIKEVTMPESVTEIGYSAFNSCDKLETVNFSDNIKTICLYAFRDCIKLKKLILPKKLALLDNDAFWGCKFSYVNFNGNTYAYETMTGYASKNCKIVK